MLHHIFNVARSDSGGTNYHNAPYPSPYGFWGYFSRYLNEKLLILFDLLVNRDVTQGEDKSRIRTTPLPQIKSSHLVSSSKILLYLTAKEYKFIERLSYQ